MYLINYEVTVRYIVVYYINQKKTRGISNYHNLLIWVYYKGYKGIYKDL